MWYASHRGRSVGRILHALYLYCGLRVAENCKVGSNEVTLYGELFATYAWEGEDVPVFTFVKPERTYQLKQQVLKHALDEPTAWYSNETVDAYNKLLMEDDQC